MKLSEIFTIIWNDPRTLTQIAVAALMAAAFNHYAAPLRATDDRSFRCHTRFGEAAIFRDEKKGRTLTMVAGNDTLVYEANRVHSFEDLKEMAEDFCAGNGAPPIRHEYVNNTAAAPYYMCVTENDRKAAVLVESPTYVRVLRAGGTLKNQEMTRIPGRIENGMYYAREHCLGNTITLR